MNCSNCKKEFTRISRKEIKCPSCPFSVCKSCVSKQIMKNKSVEPCPSCNVPYQEASLKDILSKTVFEIWKRNQEKIEKIRVIGSGGFGECSLIKRGGKILVMKEPLKRELASFFSNEIHVHKLLDHQNIVPFYDSFIKRGKPHILLCPCIYGSLRDSLKNTTFSTKNKKNIIRQVITGLEYLLRMKVLHRDLKQGNILFDEKMNVRIGDFGLSIIAKDGKLFYRNCGTSRFKAPEILRRDGYSFEIDRWSLGVLMYYLFLGQYPFQGNDKNQIEQEILKHRFTFPTHATKDERECFEWILNPNPKQRPTLEEMKTHPFLRM